MRQSDRSHGFTTLELLISASIALIVLTAVLSTFVYLGRNLTRLANYQTLEGKSRQALTYLRRDFFLAQSVKQGTTPTTTSVTLVLPAGEVTYTYDSTAKRLRRQATFGANADLYLLQSETCGCETFAFDYYNTSLATNGAASQLDTTVYVPLSIKQIRVRFTLKTPGTYRPTQVQYDTVSSRYVLRNTQPPTGT